MRNNSALWIGLIIGAAAGAGLAILVSSDKGKEIIEDIKDTAGKAEDEVKKALHNLEETLYRGKELAGKLEKKAGQFIKHAR